MELSNKNIKKIVWGGIYDVDLEEIEKYLPRYNDNFNHQHYGIWIPVHYINKNNEDNYYMIDTYQVDGDLYENRFGTKEIQLEEILKGLENLKDGKGKSGWVCNMPYDYYYSAIVKLTDENLAIFHFIADLHNYKIVDKEATRYYDEKDYLYGIRLYNCHNYPTGIYLLKKNAQINYDKKIKVKLSDMFKYNIETPKSASNYVVDEILELEKEAIKNNAIYDKEDLDKKLKLNEFINILELIYTAYKDNSNSIELINEINKLGNICQISNSDFKILLK